MQDVAEASIPDKLKHVDGIRVTGPGAGVARCPAHDDQRASLSWRVADNRKLLLYCHAGCTYWQIIAALRNPGKIVPISPARRARGQSKSKSGKPGKPYKPQLPVTLEELAAAKKLPVEFLHYCGLMQSPIKNHGVLISYFDLEKKVIAYKLRYSLIAKDGSRWPQGIPLALYGLWRLRGDLKRTRGTLYFCEGESDCWTLWYRGCAALGFPGATTFKLLKREHLKGVKRISIIREPDQGGDAFAAGLTRRLRELGFMKKGKSK